MLNFHAVDAAAQVVRFPSRRWIAVMRRAFRSRDSRQTQTIMSSAGEALSQTTLARKDLEAATMGKIIGIDLGTTNSVVAVMEGGSPR